MGLACGKKSGETDCAADANCAYGAGVCEINKSKEREFRRDMMQALTDKCGTLAGIVPNDDCPFQDTEASCKSEQNCNWKTASAGTIKPDEAGTKCVMAPPEGSCRKKTGEDASAAMMKTLCPGVESSLQLQQECATKPDEQKISCAFEKCPILAVMMAGLSCGLARTQDACASLGDACTWDGKCSANYAPLLDKIVPESCPLRPFFEQLLGPKNSQSSAEGTTQMQLKCGAASTEDACGDAGAQCQWVTHSTCMSEGAAPTSTSVCGYNMGVQVGEAMAHLLGPVGVQMKKCSESKTQTACEATPKGSVQPAAVWGDTGTSIPMGSALTIGVVVSLVIYS